MTKKGKPTVYLIHYAEPIHHAQHYLGWTRFLDARVMDHNAGRGARLPAVFLQRGIRGEVVRKWQGGRELERRLKNRHEGPRLCPVCRRRKGVNGGN